MNCITVKNVTPSENYELILKFSTNEIKKFDMKPYLDFGRYEELKSKNIFDSVFVSFDTIEWANNLDIDPEFLYEKSTIIKQEK